MPTDMPPRGLQTLNAEQQADLDKALKETHDALLEAAAHLDSAIDDGTAPPGGSHETAARRIADAQTALAKVRALTRTGAEPSADASLEESTVRHA